jgi:hypothetical protein
MFDETIHGPDVDPELIYFDFLEVHASDPDRALVLLHALLLDESSCRARVAYYKRLETERPEESTDTIDAWEPWIAALLSDGPAGAVRAGRLTLGRIDALTRAPAALAEAHRRLVAFDPAAVPSHRAMPPTGFSYLVRADQWHVLEAKLPPFLRAILILIGRDEALAADWMEFLRRRLKSAPLKARQSFGGYLYASAPEFFAEHGCPLNAEELPDWNRSSVVEFGVLLARLERLTQPDRARKFASWVRQSVQDRLLAGRGSPSLDLLGGIEPSPAFSPPDREVFPVFCHQLGEEIRDEVDDARYELELV